MKLKVATGLALFAGISAAANAATPAPALNVGALLFPGVQLLNTAGPLINPVLQPVLSKTAPFAGAFVASLHPTFVMIGTLATSAKLPPLPGLPQ
jgi:hypothetical protein